MKPGISGSGRAAGVGVPGEEPALGRPAVEPAEGCAPKEGEGAGVVPWVEDEDPALGALPVKELE